jgi:hypothetical protein
MRWGGAGVAEDAGDELVGVDGLGQVVDHAGGQAGGAFFVEGVGGLADDGQAGARARICRVAS